MGWFTAYTANKDYCVTWDTDTGGYWLTSSLHIQDYRIPSVYRKATVGDRFLPDGKEVLWATLTYKLRERVEARTSGGRWCPAKIVQLANEDGAYQIRYGNGNHRRKALHELR